MKRREYRKVICKGFCDFYKPGKEEFHCGSYDFLRRNLSYGELVSFSRTSNKNPRFSKDRAIESLACKHCDFLKDGCDFRMGLQSAPCGGYSIIEHLLNKYSH